MGDGHWIIGKLCTARGILTKLFQGDLGYDVDTAKAKCAEGCNARDDCKFANLYWVSSMQVCYLNNDKCGNYQTNEHPAYRLYIKA